jgi:hypothetical protein
VWNVSNHRQHGLVNSPLRAMAGLANKQANVHPVKTGMPTRKHPNNERSFIAGKIVEAGNLCCRWLAVF